jgi:hypothetical protein
MSDAIKKFKASAQKSEVVILFPHETREILEEINRLKRLLANSQVRELISSGQANMEDLD